MFDFSFLNMVRVARTGCVDFSPVQGRDLSDEFQLHVRGHCHGETLRVHQVRGQPLGLQPDLMLPPREAKYSGLN